MNAPVILSPQRGITVTREQMEAHLTLHGWQPMYVGRGAAMNENELVVYCFDNYAPGALALTPFGDVGVGIAEQTLARLNLKKKSGAAKQMCDGCWYMSDKYFWPLAHHCVEVDNQGKT